MKSKRKIVYLENKRLKITTNDGKSITGRYKIVDEKTLSIKGRIIPMEKIIKIKSIPVGLEVLKYSLSTFGGGFLVAGVNAAAQPVNNNAYFYSENQLKAFVFIPLSLAATTFGILSTQFPKSLKTELWEYKINITTTNG